MERKIGKKLSKKDRKGNERKGKGGDSIWKSTRQWKDMKIEGKRKRYTDGI